MKKTNQKIEETEQKLTKKIDSIIIAMYKNEFDITEICASCDESEEYVKDVIDKHSV